METEMTRVNRYAIGEDLGYLCNGEATDWMYGDDISKARIYAMTTEVGLPADDYWPSASRILPLVTENLRANLVTAQAAGNYVIIDRPNVIYQVQRDSVQISVPFINAGVLNTAKTIDIKVSFSDLDFDSIEHRGIPWQATGSLVIHSRPRRTVGTKVALAVEGNYDGGMLIDALIFRIGPASVLYTDDAETTRCLMSSVSAVITRALQVTATSHY